MKTAELTGAQLDYWVAKALGMNVVLDELEDRGVCWDGKQPKGFVVSEIDGPNYDRFSPSQWWEQGGPIIERGRIDLQPHMPRSGNSLGWEASEGGLFGWEEEGISGVGVATGPTPLIAAMRAKVASVYGEEVPDA